MKKYDERRNLIYYKDSSGIELWKKYNENNNLIHSKDSNGNESWYEWEDDIRVGITKQYFYKLKEQEFLSREYCSRFEIMDI